MIAILLSAIAMLVFFCLDQWGEALLAGSVASALFAKALDE